MKNKENHDVMHEEAACEYGTNVRSEWKIEWKNLERIAGKDDTANIQTREVSPETNGILDLEVTKIAKANL